MNGNAEGLPALIDAIGETMNPNSDMSSTAILDCVAAFVAADHGLFIDGNMTNTVGCDRIEIVNPASGRGIGTSVVADVNDVDRAVASAKRTFDTGTWTSLLPAERERILLRFADLVEAHAEELAQIETINQGMSINIARAISVAATIGFMRYTAGLTTKVTGQTLDVSISVPPGSRYTAFTRREPVGVVAAIAPWNFPLMIGLWKIMPALAAGCSVVLKPSELTPLTSLRVARLALDAGVPPGVLNIVTGGRTTGEALINHPDISKISFTGSTAAGKAIGKSAGERLIRNSLELGGKNPAIFLNDVPIDKAVAGAMLGGFVNSGQVCAAASRLYVARERFEDFVEALSDAVGRMSVGPGLDPATQINPVVSAAHRDGIVRHIDEARLAGARIIEGGDVPNQNGYYVRPTLVVDVTHDSPICRKEVFGPVVTIMPFDDEQQAVELANDTAMGLTASVWTNDLGKAFEIMPKIRAGTVWINSHSVIDPNLPFGGMKESGIGRDFGTAALDSYTELKSVCIAY